MSLQHSEAKEFVSGISQCTAEHWKSKDASRQCLNTHLEILDQYGEMRLRPEVRLEQPVRETEIYTRPADRHVVLHAAVRAKPTAGSDDILTEIVMCAATCGSNSSQNLKKAFASGFQTLAGLLDSAYRSLDFYTWQLRGISAGELGGYTCSICLGSADGRSSNATVLTCLPQILCIPCFAASGTLSTVPPASSGWRDILRLA